MNMKGLKLKKEAKWKEALQWFNFMEFSNYLVLQIAF